ncbi:MAG: dCTP deaminase [Candidatus Methanospirareceae archaeon]
MALLTDGEIKKKISEGVLKIENFSEDCLEPASYDMRLGEQAFKSRHERGLINIKDSGMITIEPGEFTILTTHERIELPKNIAGHIGLRSHYARKGVILLSGPQIDPGFKGLLTVAVYNVGPRDVVIPFLEKFCTTEYYALNIDALKPYKGEYQNQIKIPTSDIEFLREAKGATLAEVIESVGSLARSVNSLEATVSGLKTTIVLLVPIIGAVVAIVTLAVMILVP